MSRQQWGNGYWNGFYDALNGDVLRSIRDDARYWVCWMCIMNSTKDYSKSLFSVRLFIAWCECTAGLSKTYAKRIYNYILKNEPYGCYVSGEYWQSWDDDDFVLPSEPTEYWLSEIEHINRKIKEDAE